MWRWSRRRNDPGLLLLVSHGHDLLLLLSQTLHLCLQEAQRRVQSVNGACIVCQVDVSWSDTCIITLNTQVCQSIYSLIRIIHNTLNQSQFQLSPYCICPPPPSSQGDLGAAPSGLHLSARSMLPWLVSVKGVMGSEEGVTAPPELGLTGAVTPFLLTTFRKAVLPIF